MTRVTRKLDASRLNKVLRRCPSRNDIKRVQKVLRCEINSESPDYHRVRLLVQALEMMLRPKYLVDKVADMKRQLASKKRKISDLKKRLRSPKVMGAEEYQLKFAVMIGDFVATMIDYMKSLEGRKEVSTAEANAWATEWEARRGKAPDIPLKDMKQWRAFTGPTSVVFPQMQQQRNQLRLWKQKKLKNPASTKHHPQIPHLVRLKSVVDVADPRLNLTQG